MRAGYCLEMTGEKNANQIIIIIFFFGNSFCERIAFIRFEVLVRKSRGVLEEL